MEAVVIDKAREIIPLPQLLVLQRQGASRNLAVVIAHELNNMLSVIMASAELAGRAVERAEDPSRDLGRVGEAAERAAELLGDFLRFTGQRAADEEDLEPSEVIASMSRLLDRSARRGIRLGLHLEPTGHVRILRAALEASVLGLVDNAREALSGSGEISIVSEPRHLDGAAAVALGLPPGSYASVRVKDSGPGLSGELLRRAWEPYFTTKSVGESAGLGLTAVRAFARAAGGTVVLTALPQGGTTAELLLPLTGPQQTAP